VEEPVAVHPKAIPLLCGVPVRGVAATAICVYFAYSGYADLSAGRVEFNDGWAPTLTWLVWAVLMAALLSETRFWRERIVFALLLVNFAVGLAFSLWSAAPVVAMRRARELSIAIWVLAAVFSCSTLFRHRTSVRPAT
jgi:hypothetical protein